MNSLFFPSPYSASGPFGLAPRMVCFHFLPLSPSPPHWPSSFPLLRNLASRTSTLARPAHYAHRPSHARASPLSACLADRPAPLASRFPYHALDLALDSATANGVRVRATSSFVLPCLPRILPAINTAPLYRLPSPNPNSSRYAALCPSVAVEISP